MNLAGMKILVTGITGTLGEKAAVRFLKEAAEVRALIRDSKYMNKFRELGITPVLGELTNRPSLEEALKNIDIIIHCAAYLGNELEKAVNSNVTGVDLLASVSMKAGVRKFIHISTLSVYGQPEEGFFDETTPLVQKHEEVYVETKAESERILSKYMKEGLDVVILRPGAICSEENSYWGDRQVYRMLNTDTVDWVHPDDMVPWIHADNLAEMIHLVLAKGVSNEIYNAVDGNFPESDFRVKLINTLGKNLKIPGRKKECALFSNSKIKGLGYRPVKTFQETVTNLDKLAVSQLETLDINH
ncbi:NAD-dependent epimerase/dehydratase family protein [Peribacillus deserti]|uniref:Epimerase n=1 Tax=Peribacillus deserti TaxID=673318 RepID=A0A2N5M2E3_9BACI|nr:NAD(P)-dependent oxidoreductase [Peribacillus deserti]PLT28485.1 epimerase [Peribacillus deserti]